MPKLSAREIQDFIHRSFTSGEEEAMILIEEVEASRARLRLRTHARNLRPGATVSGPTQMALADTAAWTMILHNLGLPSAPSVTSNLNMSFLSRPEPVDLIAEVQLLKLGKRLSVSEVKLFSDGKAEPVSHATVTYAVILHQASPT